jgi:hypothetical protein
MQTWQLLLMLWAGHYLADFPLQGDFLATHKGLRGEIALHTLTAHGFIQGLVAGLISQSFLVGIFVGATHWVIDSLGLTRSGRRLGFTLDQALHLAMVLVAGLALAP